MNNCQHPSFRAGYDLAIKMAFDAPKNYPTAKKHSGDTTDMIRFIDGWYEGKRALRDDYVLMPRKLTAENGAKKLFLGEFFEYSQVYDTGIEDYCSIETPIEWTTIKEIYKLAVEKFGKEIP